MERCQLITFLELLTISRDYFYKLCHYAVVEVYLVGTNLIMIVRIKFGNDMDGDSFKITV